MKFAKHPRLARAFAGAVPVVLLGLLSACVTPPPRTYAVPAPPPQRVFVYPAHGQSPEQTERDRYECHTWAVQQTGVDPSRADASAYERVIVQPSTPPGANTVGGAVAGGALGAQVGRSGGAGTRDVQRCENVPSQAQPSHWDVTYNFRGQEHRIQTAVPPGPTITVNQNGEPRT